MYKRQSAYVVFFALVVIGFFVFIHFLSGQGLDRTDPVKVANYVLKLILVGDVDGLLELMPDEQKKAYIPFTPEKREELQQQVTIDREKIGKSLEISEIREYSNPGGNPTVAAKIRKKSNEVFVIVLTLKENIYYYYSILSIGSKAYKQLKLIKKA